MRTLCIFISVLLCGCYPQSPTYGPYTIIDFACNTKSKCRVVLHDGSRGTLVGEPAMKGDSVCFNKGRLPAYFLCDPNNPHLTDPKLRR